MASTGQILGAIAGAIIGFIVTGGNPLGAIKGAALGYTIGTAFTSVELPPGPKVENKQFTDSSYGAVIPELYGTDVVPTNVIWMKDNEYQEVGKKQEVAKNQYQTQYTYYGNFALSLGVGPIRRIVRIYANNILIFNADSGYVSSNLASTPSPFQTKGSIPGQKVGLGGGQSIRIGGAGYRSEQKVIQPAMRFYRGDYQQLPDPLILNEEGVNAPAFRGISYIVFENFELSKKFFNTMPTFKIVAERVDFNLDIVSDAVVLDADKLSFTTDDGSITDDECYIDIINSLVETKYGVDAIRANFTLVPYQGGHMCITAASNGTIYSSWGDVGNAGGNSPWDASGKVTTKSIRMTYTNSVSASFPITYVRNALSVIAMQHDKNTLIVDTGNGGSSTYDKPTAAHLFSEECWLYPFDIPTKNTSPTPWYETGNPVGNLQSIIPVINTNDLFLVMWAEGATGTFYWGIAKLRNGRFRVNRLDGFDPRNYDPIGSSSSKWTVHYGTSLAFTNSENIRSRKDRLTAFYHNDNVYIHMNTYGGIQAWVPNMCATIVVPIGDRNFGYPTPFIRRNALFDWSTFTSYTAGDFYSIDNEMYQFFSQRKFITDWYAVPYQYGRLIPDYETGDLYAHQTFTFDATATTAFPTLSSIVNGHLYKLDPDTLAPTVDYGDFTAYLETIKPRSQTFTQHENGVHQINGLYLARVIKDVLYIMTSYGIFKIANNTFADYKLILEDNYVVGLIEKNGDAFGTLNYKTNPGFYTYFQNLIPLTMTDDVTEVLVGTYILDGSYAVVSSSYSNFGYETWFNCYAEYCVVRFFHGPYTADLQNDTVVTLDEVVAAQVLKSELLDSGDYVVTGLADKTFRGMVVAEQAPALNTVQALQQTYLFDIIEEDYQLKFIQRKNATITRTIAYTDLQAAEVGEQPFEIKPTVPANFKAPSIFQASYRDYDLDYEVGTQTIEIPYGENGGLVSIPFPVTLTGEEAYGLLESITRSTEYAQRGIVDIQLPMKHSDLEINKFITFGTAAGDTFTGRIINIDKGKPGLVKITVIFDSLLNYGQSSFTYEANTRDFAGSKNKEIFPIVLDALPFNSVEDAPGFWIGAYVVDSSVNVTYTLFVSYDEGATYDKVFTQPARAQAAYCLTALPSTGGTTYIDYTSTLTIKPLGGDFSTVTSTQLLASEMVNTYFYGREGSWEIIKVLGWTDNGNGTYSSSGIIRGYKGTAHYMEGHEIGDRLYGANPTLTKFNVDIGKLNQPVSLRFSTESGYGTEDVKIVDTVVQFQGRLPLPVINVTGRRLSTNDWYFEWTRQSRVGIEFVNFSDVQQDDPTEQYNVYIINTASNNVVVRTISVTDVSNATYTSAQQVTDFGSNRTTITVAIAKVSTTVGVGIPTLATF